MPIHSETIEMIAINAGFNPSMKAGRGGGIAPPGIRNSPGILPGKFLKYDSFLFTLHCRSVLGNILLFAGGLVVQM